MNKLILDSTGMLLAQSKYDSVEVTSLYNNGIYSYIEEAHEGPIKTMYFLPEYKGLLTGGEDDNLIKLWDLRKEGFLQSKLPISQRERGLFRTVYAGHTDSINDVLTINDYVISASSDNTVRIWNINSGSLLTTLEDHTDEVYSLAVSNDYLVSGSLDKSIKVWNLQTGDLSFTLYGHTSNVNKLAIKDNYLASASWDNTVKLWDLETGILINTFGPIRDIPNDLMFHPHSYSLFIAAKSNIYLWNSSTDEIELMLQGHLSSISSIAITQTYSKDDNQLVSVSLDGDVKNWSIYTGISHD